MSKQAAELVSKLKSVFNGDNKADVFPAIVTAVNSDGTVNVKDMGDYEYNCRTQAMEGQTLGLQIKPAIDSVVMVERIGTNTDEQYCLMLYSAIDEASWLIAGYKYMLNNSGHLLASPGGDTVLEVLNLIIEAVEKIKIFQGTNPDFIKLTQAKTKANEIFQ